WIVTAIKEHVYKNCGTDYLLVLTNEAGRKIFAIDNIDRDTKKRLDSEYVNSTDYYTIMFGVRK
ncbi:MAG: hypothetical protein GY777_12255, partial [Candidatus Brocadiaceae bacterium]|nr:hypothetical protein [Candidatus Brocadiaceae bacterium]